MTSPADTKSSSPFIPEPLMPLKRANALRTHYYQLSESIWLARHKYETKKGEETFTGWSWCYTKDKGITWCVKKGDNDPELEDYPLYASSAISEAVNNSLRLFIPEGEKDVEKLLDAGYLATTLGSATDFNKRIDKLKKALAGSSIPIYLIPDNDNTGLEYSRKIYNALSELKDFGGDIYWIDLGLTKAKADVSDYFDIYGSGKFQKLVEKAQLVEKDLDISFSRANLDQSNVIGLPDQDPPSKGLTEAIEGDSDQGLSNETLEAEIIQLAPAPDHDLIDLRRYFPTFEDYTKEGTEFEPLIDGLIYKGQRVLLSGSAGVGKSLLALDLAIKVVRSSGRVLYIDYEQTKKSIAKRFKGLGLTAAEMNQRLFYYSRSADDDLPLFDGKKVNTETLAKIIKAIRPDLIVIDTFSQAFTGLDSNSADQINAFFKVIKDLQKESPNATWLALDHIGKDPDRGTRGSSAKIDNYDLAFTLSGAGDYLKLSVIKDRDALLESTTLKVNRSINASGDLEHLIEIPGGRGSSKVDQYLEALRSSPEKITSQNKAERYLRDKDMQVTRGSKDLIEALSRYQSEIEN